MRAVVQRVTSARVTVEGEDVGVLDAPGLVVFVGVHRSDGAAQVSGMVRKVASLRIMRGERSALDDNVPLLVVSQFTLYADTSKGRRPSWSGAAPAEVAEPVVSAVVSELSALGLHVQTGRFGADMQVSLVNDGPVTLLLEV